VWRFGDVFDGVGSEPAVRVLLILPRYLLGSARRQSLDDRS
jgi:hypothetical protein